MAKRTRPESRKQVKQKVVPKVNPQNCYDRTVAFAVTAQQRHTLNDNASTYLLYYDESLPSSSSFLTRNVRFAVSVVARALHPRSETRPTTRIWSPNQMTMVRKRAVRRKTTTRRRRRRRRRRRTRSGCDLRGLTWVDSRRRRTPATRTTRKTTRKGMGWSEGSQKSRCPAPTTASISAVPT